MQPECSDKQFVQHKDAELMSWHQRLGHPSDHYLHNAHKYVQGVPQFKHQDGVLDKCPTCIRAKQTKEPAGPNATRTATVPYQGLSIDFAFSGTRSKDEKRAKKFKGCNGETCWILITDHASRMKHGDARISKGTPLAWLRHFLEKHSPNCQDKHVCMDQGGELHKNPEVHELFTEFHYWQMLVFLLNDLVTLTCSILLSRTGKKLVILLCHLSLELLILVMT